MTFRPVPATRRGFTLVEMLVVIGVIVLLFGLTVAVIPAVTGASQKREIESTLKLLDLSLDEFKRATEREISWGTDGEDFQGNSLPTAKYDMQQDDTLEQQCLQLVERLDKNQQAREVLTRIDTDLLSRDDAGAWQLVDPWGTPILAIHPGRKWQQGFDSSSIRDSDESIFWAQEDIYGVAVNRRIYFVSAGPDKRFGSLSPTASDQEKTDAEDNIYSYEVVRP